MDETRRGEIAIAILKDRLRTDGFSKLDSSSVKRSVGNLAKRTNIPCKELLEFGQNLIEEVVKETFEEAKKEKN